MRINLRSEVDGYYTAVISHFNRELFEYLKPPGARIKLKEFTGSETGDRVHIQFLFPAKAEWISIITDHGVSEREAYFVDEGEQLPWPLKRWKHRHSVQKVSHKTSMILDEMEYESGNTPLDWLLYPILFLSFYPRKSQYKRFFKERFNPYSDD